MSTLPVRTSCKPAAVEMPTDIHGVTMKAIVDLCVIPIDAGISLSPYVAACEKVLDQYDLHCSLHANGTNIEGELDEVLAAVKRCHETLHDMGVRRVFSTLKLGTRVDKEQTMQDKIRSVQEKL